MLAINSLMDILDSKNGWLLLCKIFLNTLKTDNILGKDNFQKHFSRSIFAIFQQNVLISFMWLTI